MKKDLRKYIYFIITFIYLMLVYSYIVYNFSLYVRITNKPLGWFLLIAQTLMYIIIFAIINHIFIKKILSWKLLIIIELSLLITIITLILSDHGYEVYLENKYIQRTTSYSTLTNRNATFFSLKQEIIQPFSPYKQMQELLPIFR